jgi:hypothetical protein
MVESFAFFNFDVVEIAIIEFAIEAKARPREGGAATRRRRLEQGEQVRFCERLTFVAARIGPDISSSHHREEKRFINTNQEKPERDACERGGRNARRGTHRA